MAGTEQLENLFYESLIARGKGYKLTDNPLTPGYIQAAVKMGVEVSAVVQQTNVRIDINLPTVSGPSNGHFETASCGGKNFLSSSESLLLTSANLDEILERTVHLVNEGMKLAKKTAK